MRSTGSFPGLLQCAVLFSFVFRSLCYLPLFPLSLRAVDRTDHVHVVHTSLPGGRPGAFLAYFNAPFFSPLSSDLCAIFLYLLSPYIVLPEYHTNITKAHTNKKVFPSMRDTTSTPFLIKNKTTKICNSKQLQGSYGVCTIKISGERKVSGSPTHGVQGLDSHANTL